MSVYAQPTHLIVRMVKGTGNIFYRTKNRVRRCCVGGDMTSLIFGSFQTAVFANRFFLQKK